MVNEIQYTSIRRVLDNLLDHPMLRDLTLEQAVRHTLRFISLHGYSKLYEDKIVEIDIQDFRGLLPCDLISIIQVRDMLSGECLRAMGDNFNPGFPRENDEDYHKKHHIHPHHPHSPFTDNFNLPYSHLVDRAFKTQGRVIYTSFCHGRVEVAYKAIPVDEDGFPLLIDNETYLACLEAYIKKQVFTVKFDTGKIASNVLENAKQEYQVLSKRLLSEFSTPSVSEMESITRMMSAMIPSVREFDRGFRTLGRREYLRKH